MRLELEREQRQLLDEQERVERQILAAHREQRRFFRFPMRRTKPSAEALRQKQVLDLAESEQRCIILRQIAKLEREGNHREARNWRHTLVGLRARIAQEFNFRESA
jgi:hypothetical protein